MVKQGIPERKKSTLKFKFEDVDAHEGGAGDFAYHVYLDNYIQPHILEEKTAINVNLLESFSSTLFV